MDSETFNRLDEDEGMCREMPTRRCPITGCEDLPCARFESKDESRWALDIAQWRIDGRRL